MDTGASERALGRRRSQRPAARPDAHQAGRDVIGALMSGPPAAAADIEVEAEVEAEVETASNPERKDRRSHPVAPTGVPTAVEFPPKRGARRLMGMVALIVLAATGGAAYLAYDDPTILTIGVTATLGVLLLVVWAIRAGTPLTVMSVKGGQLEVRQGGLHLKFDLASHYTPIRAQGRPGRPGWRVLFGRGTLPPFVVDSSIVDPRTFMEVLDSYRPE